MESILTGAALFLVTALIAALIKCFSKKVNKHKDAHIYIDNLSGLLTKLEDFMTKHTEEHECLKVNDAQLKENAMLHTREAIVRFYYKGKEQGHLNRYELKLVEDLYKNYSILGGNSFVKDLVTEIRNGTYKL